MGRNRVKIVSNQEAGTISYYFQNEKGEWMPVSSASLLSRREFRYAAIAEKGQAILETINEMYNYGERGQMRISRSSAPSWTSTSQKKIWFAGKAS